MTTPSSLTQSWEHLNIEEERHVHDVIVVGAGVSGLVAAHRLKQAGIADVVVLEAKGRVGGRTFGATMKGRDGTMKIDLGGQWVGSTQPHALRLLDELGIKLYKQFDTGKNVIQMSDGRARLYTGTIPSCLSIVQLLNIGLLQLLVDSLVAKVDVAKPSRTPNAAALDDETLASFVRRTSVSSALYETLTMVSRVVWGCDLSQISLLYALRYFRSAGTFMQVCESSEGGGQEFRPQGGAAQIAQRLHELVGTDKVHLAHPVARMEQSAEGVHVVCSNEREFRAKFVIMAIPPHLAGRVEYSPPMPAPRDQYTQRTPMGHLIKFVVTYSDAFWRSKGWSGQAISNFGPVCMVADATTHPDGQPALVGFIGGSQATLWSPRSVEERREAVVTALVSLFGQEASALLDYAEKDWGKEEWNGGCPVSLMSPGTLTVFEDVIRAPVGRIHFAGTETADVWYGFINGAIEAGERACNEVKERILSGESGADALRATLPPPPVYKKAFSSGVDVVLTLAVAGVGILAYRVVSRYFLS